MWGGRFCEVQVSAEKGGTRGFTLLELIVVLAVVGVLSAVAVPAFSAIYGECCLKTVVFEIGAMIREAKQRALDEQYYGLCFDTVNRKVTLVSGRGPDGKWNTGDEPVVRTIDLKTRGGGLKFGDGGHGPVSGLVEAEDGLTINSNTTLVCNPELTNNTGTIYVQTSSGAAMALTMNNADFGYKMNRWNGKTWVRM